MWLTTVTANAELSDLNRPRQSHFLVLVAVLGPCSCSAPVILALDLAFLAAIVEPDIAVGGEPVALDDDSTAIATGIDGKFRLFRVEEHGVPNLS